MHHLLILPHAGGATHSYGALKRMLEPRLEVSCYELPGRGYRAREMPVSSMQAAVLDVLERVDQLRGKPWSLFGHSMGALLADAVVGALPPTGLPMPDVLFVSGTAAPGGLDVEAISHLPSRHFWAKVTEFGGVPDEVLNSRDLLEYFEPFLRQDFQLIEAYSPSTAILPVPIVALYGTEDMTRSEAETWTARTICASEVHAFFGNHFYLQAHARAVASLLIEVLVRRGKLQQLT